ncbi:RelA/SpoT family protein, partial [Bacteroidota bacterium]
MSYTIDIEEEKREILRRYRNLLSAWSGRKEPADKRIVRKAFNLAVDAHKDMRRKTGEPYIYHPLEVAKISAGEIGLGTTSIVCALLHDVVEDTDYTLKDIRSMFGEKYARIIDGLTKIDEIFDQSTTSIQAENFKKILLTLADDVRVILIKLADRLHNMRTLDALSKEKRMKISSETIYLFAPLAHRLGLFAIKSELEDLVLKHTEPDIFNSINQKIIESKEDRRRFTNKFIYPIKKELAKDDLDFKIIAREKSVYSIWKKIQGKGIPFEEIYDIFAIRIIIDVPPEKEKTTCWKVYSIITDNYRPNMKRLRDWISIPKANGYEALHTTVMSNSGKWVEIQVRSKRMDEIAEKGYAAHWKYKDNLNAAGGLDEWLNKIQEIIRNDESNALDFLSDFKLNLFSDEIIAFTPKGDLKSLPIGATVLDFAYNVHSQVGNTAIGAKVNHNLVPLSYSLKSGDQVEIITSKKQTPKEEWLNFIVSARARHRIKAVLKEVKKEAAPEGKDKLKLMFEKANIPWNNKNVEDFRRFVNSENQNDLFYKVTKEKITERNIKAFNQANDKGGWLKAISRPFSKSRSGDNMLNQKVVEKLKKEPESMLLDTDINELKYEEAKCCNPIPGDDIIGFLKTNGSIEIHRTNCEKAVKNMSSYGNRIVKTKWKTDENIGFLAGIQIQGI